MEKYLINGSSKLKGIVSISGSKNAALPIMIASIMCNEDIILYNVPDVQDVKDVIEMLLDIGAKVEKIDRHTFKINGSNINKFVLDNEYVNKIRASYYFLGVLAGKYGKAKIIYPGGCDIGARPIDLHLKGFKLLGITAYIYKGEISVDVNKLAGNKIFLDKISVGATINIMIAAVKAEGITIIENCAKEPHVVDTANFLNSMGANIIGAGTSVIKIKGVKNLHGCSYSIIPDQIETGTFMAAAAITKGDITVKNVISFHVQSMMSKLVDIGCKVYNFGDKIRVIGPEKILPTKIITQVYPGYPTDLQPLISVVLTLAEGNSIIVENIFENRFKYVLELIKMGADISIEGNIAIINGVKSLFGSEIFALDLRAGAALVLAGIVAKGTTIIKNIKYIKRGYEDFDEKLRALGADIQIIDSDNNKLFKKVN